MSGDEVPAQITFNPLYRTTYEGNHPARGYVYNLSMQHEPSDEEIERVTHAIIDEIGGGLDINYAEGIRAATAAIKALRATQEPQP